ncbi:MAG TPA: 30S ribosomal protein S2 [Candidatus Paceibacterota bacterium]|nr:30S ribosomal protein S2 [Candidatus Paceibacterota bacterium]
MDTQNIVDDMFRAGVQYGYSKSRRHPSVSPYVFTTKNGLDIIDIEKSEILLEKACQEVSALAASGKVILFVGTKPESRQQITETALALEMPYVSERWVGGALTNFSEIKKRISKLLEMREQKEKGAFEKYTKKEKLLIDREMEDMTRNFQGLTGISKNPDAVFVVDPKKEHIAVSEAKKLGLPVFAVLNTDCNLKEIDYPIVGNDASVTSITFFLDKIKEAYRKGASGINN